MERQIIAYTLLIMLIGAGTALILYVRHHGSERTAKRQQLRQREKNRAAQALRAEAAERPVT